MKKKRTREEILAAAQASRERAAEETAELILQAPQTSAQLKTKKGNKH
jgi:hypothetical protein